MIGIDTNVLVALAVKSHPSHSQAVALFERELSADEEIALSISVAAEFLHAVTDLRRFTPALEMAEAIRWLRLERRSRSDLAKAGRPSHRTLA